MYLFYSLSVAHFIVLHTASLIGVCARVCAVYMNVRLVKVVFKLHGRERSWMLPIDVGSKTSEPESKSLKGALMADGVDSRKYTIEHCISTATDSEYWLVVFDPLTDQTPEEIDQIRRKEIESEFIRKSFDKALAKRSGSSCLKLMSKAH
jgi:hypothetical protein